MNLHENALPAVNESAESEPVDAAVDAFFFKLSYKPIADKDSNEFDQLERERSFLDIEIEVASFLRMYLHGANVVGRSPMPVDSGFEAIMEIRRPRLMDSGIPMPSTTLEESVQALAQDIADASELLRIGHQVAVKRKLGLLGERKPIKVAKPSQRTLVKLDDDGTIWTSRLGPEALVRKARKLLAAAAEVNAAGYALELVVGREKKGLSELASDSLKVDWLVDREERWKVVPTGYLTGRRYVEFTRDRKGHMLVVPSTGAEMYEEAVRAEKAIDMTVEVSRPSNPLLTDEPKYRICVTHAVVPAPGQTEMSI